MVGCLGTRVPKQPIIVLYVESEAILKFYNLEARFCVAEILTCHPLTCTCIIKPPEAHCIKINIHFYGGLGSGRMVVGDGDMLGWRWSFCNVCSLINVY